MSMPMFLLGFDTEAPYGSQAKTYEGKRALDQTMLTVMRLNALFDSYKIARTHFILGSFLENAEEELGNRTLREIFLSSNLIDIESHGFAHRPFKTIPTRPEKVPLTADEVYQDVVKSKETIKRILGKDVIGIRAPLGYANGLDGCDGVINALKKAGMKYVSSDLRDKRSGINGPFIQNGILRLAREYSNGLIEVPSHGWQDTVFIGSKTKGAPDFSGMNKKDLQDFIVNHYKRLINKAIKHVDLENRGSLLTPLPMDRNIAIGGCFHPQAIYSYDRDLSVFRRVLDYALENKVLVVDYSSQHLSILP